MNLLLDTIRSLNKEESRYYKIFTRRTHKDSERKDIILFDIIKNDIENYDEKYVSEKIYGNNKNNFYQLKSKLVDSINKSLISQYSLKEKESFISNLILLSGIYKRKGKFSLSYHYLKKAEKEAQKIESFESLSTLYTEILKLSHDLISIDIEKYINRKILNKKNLNLSQDIDIALSSAMYKIKTTQNLSVDNKKTSNQLKKIIKSINSQVKLSESHKFQIKLFQAISRVLLHKNDFLSLEEYVKMTYIEFERKKIFNKINHEQKLMMLTYLINSLYKNNKFQESLKCAEDLQKAMNDFDGFLKSKFLFYYYNALVINYSQLDKNKAIEVLFEAKNNKTIQGLPIFSSFIYLNMSLIYYDLKKYKLAVRNMSRLILQKDFLDLSEYFQLKILISEIIIRYNLKQTELVQEKIKKIKKSYKKILKNSNRDFKMLLVIEKIIYCINPYLDKNIVREIKLINNISSKKDSSNTDVINYNEWLDTFLVKA
tara:strand:- start:639 stop:2096 length:1458 start_codon:yes stop_codon:yes gene_type:complete